MMAYTLQGKVFHPSHVEWQLLGVFGCRADAEMAMIFHAKDYPDFRLEQWPI